MTAVLDHKVASTPARRGRPRSLHLQQVLDAALAVGLDRLTMGAVAQHLGVAKAVLYSYVDSREELTRLAGARAAQSHKFPEDCGQPWGVYVLEYSRALFELLTMDGQVLESLLIGGQTPVVEVDSSEAWLQVMTRQGFSGEEALQLRRAVSSMVVGSAANFKHGRAQEAAGAPRDVSARRAVLDRHEEQVPLLRQHLDVFARDVTTSSWEYGLYLLLQGFVAAGQGLSVDADLEFAGIRSAP